MTILEALDFLDHLHAPVEWFFHLPPWIGYTILGLLMAYSVGMAGFILARMGVRPLWALLLLVPIVCIVATWALAFVKWPAQKSSLSS